MSGYDLTTRVVRRILAIGMRTPTPVNQFARREACNLTVANGLQWLLNWIGRHDQKTPQFLSIT
jgi:hypothetical protein